MNRLAYKFRLWVLIMSALFASCSTQSTPNKLTKGGGQFALQPVVNPGTLHTTEEAAMASLGGKIPPNLEILKYSERLTSGGNATGWYVVEKTAIITESDLQHAQARPAIVGGGYQIAIKLNPKAAEKFRVWTKENSGAYLAIVIDGLVISAPVVKEEITDGDVLIDGKFTKEEAENLSDKLRRS